MRIAEDLRPLLRPIDELRPHPRNPRLGNVGEIQRSLRRFGQLRAILALPDGTIVSGNHTWRAAKAEGWDAVAAVLEPMDDATASAYLVADNRLSDIGNYDEAALAALLQEVADDAAGLAGTGYSADDLAALLRAAEDAASGRPEGERAGALALTSVVIAPPERAVQNHERWAVGPHVLVIANVFTEPELWMASFEAGMKFAPYPTPHLPWVASRAGNRLLMVTSDHYAAGHLLDRWALVQGEEPVRLGVAA